MQIYGKGPVAVMPDDAAGREIHPLFFMHLSMGILRFQECLSLASYSGIVSFLGWAFLASEDAHSWIHSQPGSPR